MKNKKSNKLSWNNLLKPIKNVGFFGFKPVPLWRNNNVRNISRKNLTWSQAQVKYPRLNPFGDNDRDGKLNMFDCRPFDSRRHSAIMRDEIANRLFLKRNKVKGAYKEVSRITKKYIMPRGERELRERFVSGEWKDDFKDADKIQKIDYRTNEGKSQAEGLLKTNYKLMTPMDVIKHIEKNPQLFKSLKKVKTTILNPSMLKGIDASTSIKGDEIDFKSSYPNRLDIGELLEHEIAHVEQGKKLRDKLRGSVKDWMKKRDKISSEEYNEHPIEKDAEERRIKKREEWKSWKEEKPETLSQFEPKNKRLTNESDSNRVKRLRHGAVKIQEIDANEFKKKWEEEHPSQEKLAWEPNRLQNALDRNEDDDYPEIVVRKNVIDMPSVEVNDGRHRISAAAEKGQKIDVAIIEETEEDY